MLGSRAKLFFACICGLMSIVLYSPRWSNVSVRNGIQEEASLLVNLLGSKIRSEFDAAAIIPCQVTAAASVNGDNRPCSKQQARYYLNCTFAAVCILWKEIPDPVTLKAAVNSISRDVEFITSEKSSTSEAVSHFFVGLQNGQSLHFASWFLQADGSWWFDGLRSDADSLAAAGSVLYVGQFEGWIPSFRLRERAPSDALDAPADAAGFGRLLRDSRFVACDRRRAHQFHLREGRDVSADAQRFRHRAWRLLAAAASALDELRVPFWLSSGTCLGYYRQCDFVPYMGDVDIGVRIDSVRDWAADAALPSLAQLVAALAARRLRLVHRFGLPADSLELSFRSPDDIKLDVFFFYQDGDVMWNGGTQARTGRKFRYDFAAFDLCWTEFRELRVRVPCDTERYLIANYGPDWPHPQPVWDWKSSPPNVRENGVWTADQMPQAVQLFER